MDDVVDIVIQKADGNYIETGKIEYLEVKGLSDLTGIDKLTSLVQLSLYNYKSKTIDVSKCSKLVSLRIESAKNLTSFKAPKSITDLYCYDTKISKINLNNLTNLEKFEFTDGKITKLDLKKNKKLVYLDVQWNKLTSLNVKNCRKLEYLGASDNKKLKSIDVSKNTKLRELDITNTAVSSLNLKKNTKLTNLYTRNTKIKSLNLSKNKKLEVIGLNSKIKKLNLKKYNKLGIIIDVKRGKSVNLNNYIGKGYTVDYADTVVTYNKKKGTVKLDKNAEKGEIYYMNLKKGKKVYEFVLIAK